MNWNWLGEITLGGLEGEKKWSTSLELLFSKLAALSGTATKNLEKESFISPKLHWSKLASSKYIKTPFRILSY